LFQFVYNVYGHLGFEILPRPLRRWLNTSSAHNLHHKKFTGNYGLYTLFWDRLMGTLRSESQPQPKMQQSSGLKEKADNALLA
jgi:lathosterol oxidase